MCREVAEPGMFRAGTGRRDGSRTSPFELMRVDNVHITDAWLHALPMGCQFVRLATLSVQCGAVASVDARHEKPSAAVLLSRWRAPSSYSGDRTPVASSTMRAPPSTSR